MKNYFIYIIVFLSVSQRIFGQLKLYEDTFNGGVTCAGWSPSYFAGSPVSGTMTVSIPSGSTIRKAYLMAGQHGGSGSMNVTLNSVTYNFNSTTVVSSFPPSIYSCTSSRVHAIDITSSISASTTLYNISIPGSPYCEHYQDFYLFIAYNNPSLPTVSVGLWVNNIAFGATLNYTLNVVNPINTTNHVGLAMFAGYACFYFDREEVIVNSTNVGYYHGDEYNSGSCSGAMGQFGYHSGVLTGIGDDDPNQAMVGADALSNIQAVIPMSTTSVPLQLNNANLNGDNSIWGVVLVYGSSVTLPTYLLNLSAQVDPNKNVLLTWESNYENIDLFEIEKSIDNGRTYNIISDNIPAVSFQSIYQYIDKTGFTGNKAWYRIRCKEKDGKYTFSNAVEVIFNLENMITGMFEQPISLPNSLQYQCIMAQNTDIQYQVYDLNGKVIFTKSISVVSGKHSFEVDLPYLPSGIYHVNIISQNGLLHQHKLVVM